jgi:hypothetical protein
MAMLNQNDIQVDPRAGYKFSAFMHGAAGMMDVVVQEQIIVIVL